MISANEARRISDSSTKRVDDFIENVIFPTIMEKAEEGLYECDYIVGSIPVNRVIPEPTDFEENIVTKLCGLGYLLTYDRIGEEYVPEEERNELHKRYGYRISWRQL